jgi:predicted metalloendopeptidase
MRPQLLSLAAAACLNLGAAHAAHAAADACTDFDAHVNERWKASTELPATRARVGSFDTLRMANDRLLEAALAELAARPELQTSPGLRLLATHYRSGIDEAAIEKRGLAALQPLLTRIDNVDRAGLPALVGELSRLGVSAPIGLFVAADAKDATRNALQVQPAGLGLPDRDDYFAKEANAARLSTAYRSYVQRLLQAAGQPADAATLDAVIALETEFAQATPTRVQRRDPLANYNPSTLAALQALAPDWNWSAWLAAYTGQARPADGFPMILGRPEFLKTVAQLGAQAPLGAWKSYLTLRLLDASAEALPKAFVRAHFDYRSATIRGLKAMPPRAERLIMAIGGQYGGSPLSETLGELFVAKAFSPLAQQRAQQMVADIKAAMAQRIENLSWMSAPTKVLARAKLDAMVAKIGAPAQWKTYDGLALQADDHAGNLLRINTWATTQRLADLNRPVDRARWNTSPYIVNAFAAGGNQIVFPAGILQPPFFDAKADDASNYGGIGMVIGHEITHHFDDRGRQFDAVGNLRDWWQPQDAAAYKERADRVAALYSGFEPLPGHRINGRMTLGENISDLSGIQIAYDGLQIALERQRAAGKPAPLIDGMTPAQRFFTAHAVIWRGKSRDEALIDQLRTDGHSPPRFRILAPLANTPAFAQAFGCKAGDAMVASEPIRIW